MVTSNESACIKSEHVGLENFIRTSKAIGLKLKSGNMEPYDAYANGKLKQKNVPKKIEHKSATNYDIDRNRSTNI